MTEKEQELIRQAEEQVKSHQTIVESDPYRLHFHLMPPVGLLNDPNGFIQWNGSYHLFYQWMPFKTGHGAKFWGHYSSEDLATWKHEPIALAPSEAYEKNGCYSGSAVEHNGQMVLFYTGNVKDAKGNRETYQCMAVSNDGNTFQKLGPVVELPRDYTAHFRDPKVWKRDDYWYMVVGAQSKERKGQVALLVSTDLTKWEHVGPIAGSNLNGLGDFGYMWECPDMFSLGGVDVLVVSPQGLSKEGWKYQNVYQAGYFIGSLDYEDVRFTHGEFVELDRGFEFYAPQTTVDTNGRRLMVGWMGVPEQHEDKHPTIRHHWIHALTLPRELTFQNGRLLQNPVAELEHLRKGEATVHRNIALSPNQLELSGVHGEVLEMELEFAPSLDWFLLSISDTAKVTYSKEEEMIHLHRLSFVDGSWEKRSCALSSLSSMRIFKDTSSLELFINQGEEVFTARIFPPLTSKQSIVFSGGGEIVNLKKWELAYAIKE
ncbi:Sucrose-6-phosphate hydrolase [Bacillus sp. THAF10]|uniref:sucrose-6-phosphate hydrolase n=1 Tax=Bacillus sp. THAF10 TaxID=2587848 RepID=UPI001267F69A|nr:sucrose-6-phosphate hydrolase [Bacillus sp. THAF10]QFT91015.1 Sucrose-6-phosphate hydrolase [Bacillus sp. THAF10]